MANKNIQSLLQIMSGHHNMGGNSKHSFKVFCTDFLIRGKIGVSAILEIIFG